MKKNLALIIEFNLAFLGCGSLNLEGSKKQLTKKNILSPQSEDFNPKSYKTPYSGIYNFTIDPEFKNLAAPNSHLFSSGLERGLSSGLSLRDIAIRAPFI